jgi:hypothetical protein
VLRGRADREAAAVEVDIHDLPSAAEPAGEVAEVAGAVREMVERVHDQYHVHGLRRQRGAVAGQQRVHVLDPGLPDPRREQLHHARLDVDGMDAPGRANRPGHPDGEVPGARPHVACHVASPEPECLHDVVGALPRGPLRCLEPGEIRRKVGGVAVRVAVVGAVLPLAMRVAGTGAVGVGLGAGVVRSHLHLLRR